MKNQDTLTAKLQNAELRQLVLENSDEKVSVLIQPELPPQHVSVSKICRGGITFNSLTGVIPISPEEQKYADKQINETSAFLEKLLGTPPHWLHSAQSFVVKATPQQLRTIANCPHIKAIWLNRELRK